VGADAVDAVNRRAVSTTNRRMPPTLAAPQQGLTR
jgi:hypothetical protein